LKDSRLWAAFGVSVGPDDEDVAMVVETLLLVKVGASWTAKILIARALHVTTKIKFDVTGFKNIGTRKGRTFFGTKCVD